MESSSNLVESAPVRGVLNFAANPTNGGTWSNTDRSKITQELHGRTIGIGDARGLDRRPSLDREGFELHDAPAPDRRWTDPQWVSDVYLPHCVELVQRATGAPRVIPFGSHALIRDTGDPNSAPAAEFIHFDMNRALGAQFLRQAVGEEAFAQTKRFQVFNIWRVLTPPPQDVPLALCDQRSLSEQDWVSGHTLQDDFAFQDDFPEGAPYITSVFNPGQKWYYFSDLETDQAVVFKGYDSDESVPFGCMHGAFRYADAKAGAVPRASVEARVYALY